MPEYINKSKLLQLEMYFKPILIDKINYKKV
jgi:hypothetical protein